MPEVKIISGYPETYVEDGIEVTRLHYSFTVDGIPSLYWVPECKVKGLPPTYHIDRTIAGLRAGRSSEAFGRAPEVSVGGSVVERAAPTEERLSIIESELLSKGIPADQVARAMDVVREASKPGRGSVLKDRGDPKVEEVTSHGGRTKPREKRAGWRYTLDGVQSEDSYPTEAAARSACAFAAFMTRGKLGAVPTVLAVLQSQFPSRECRVWVCAEDYEVKASVDGKEYGIVWARVGAQLVAEKFKEK